MQPKFIIPCIALALGATGAIAATDDSSTSTSANTATNSACQNMDHLYFCDDFTTQDLSHWQQLATDGGDPDGVFDIPEGQGYLRYTAGGKGGEILLATDAVKSLLPSNGNYFVEAKIRPRQNSTTANKQLFLMGRYDSQGNWYGGGLNIQNSSSSTQVEVAISKAGSISRPVQQKKPIVLGAKGGEGDGTWYVTRFEMIDNALTVYLDGDKIGTTQDTTYTNPGNLGLFTNNRSFEMDYIKVGDPNIKPVQLSLDYDSPSWDSAIAGGDPLNITVTAIQSDGTTPDTFKATSSAPKIARVDISDNIVTITPLAEGTATITFSSGSDSGLQKTIEVNVDSAFAMPTQNYGDISLNVTPTVHSIDQFTDTTLSITFDNDIASGSKGQIQVYNADTDEIVDTIKTKDEVDIIGYEGQDKRRVVNTSLLSIDGKTLTIRLHNNKLKYGQTYYVAIGDGVVTDAKLNGIDFVGIGKNSAWQFTTKATMPTGNNLTVGSTPDDDFASVQGALNHAMENLTADTPTTITIHDGVYHELLFLRNRNNITLKGESRDGTIIQFDNYETLNSGSGKSDVDGTGPQGGRSVFMVENSDNLTLDNLTLKNTHIRSTAYSNQAEALYFSSSKRLIAKNANFISEQDTLQLKGYTWFYNTLVSGNVDFIWGNNVASVFENSEIRTVGDSDDGVGVETSGGYVLQARTLAENDPGFVFINSRFTNGAGPVGNTVIPGSTYIARSSGQSAYYDNVVLVNSHIGPHIASGGWAIQGVNGQPAQNPNPSQATAGWREYGSTDLNGNPLDLSARQGVYLLNDAEVTPYLSRDKVFANYNNGEGWNPQP